MELKTPLYDAHIECGGKIVPFAGYLLPVQYGAGVIAEHNAVRTKAGIFDVSHMGEVMFRGADALANLNNLLTNDLSSMVDGQVRYSPMCYDDGTVVDDMIVYRFSALEYLAVVNASNRHKDVEWMRGKLFGSVEMTDVSDGIAQIALQGPASGRILEKVMEPSLIPHKYYTFSAGCAVAGAPDCIVSQTGYTGEYGFEIYMRNEYARGVWFALLDAGKDEGLIPCGLGSRDTLRLEAGMPLYGHELSDSIDPLQAGLGFAVKLKKESFVGKQAIVDRQPPKEVRVGLKITGRGIVREHCPVYFGDRQIGVTTSGTHCPYLDAPFAMAMLKTEHSEPGTKVECDVRGRRIAAETVALPFYKKQ